MKRKILLSITVLLVVIFCASCFNEDSQIITKKTEKSYQSGEKASYLAGSHMASEFSDCTGCHGEDGLLDDSESQVNESCISCHGDLTEVAETTNNGHINVHASHLGDINCTACHGGHEPSALYCNNCHTFDINISHKGDKPLLRQIDIEKYAKAKSKKIEKTGVLVIGAGGSGHIAALTAKSNGADVILVEKMPIPGGNSQLAAGGMNAAGTRFQKANKINDDVDTMYNDIMKGGKDKSNKELAMILAKNSNDSMEWLISIGATLDAVNMGGGSANKRFHAPTGGTAVGSYLVNIYKAVAKREGLDVRLNSPAVKLIVDKSGAVTGAVINGKHSGLYEIHADAVILTSGGFSSNAERVVSYLPTAKGMTTSNQPGATGDGLDLAKEANANFIDMEYVQIHPSIGVGSNTLITEAVRGVGAMMVNHDGKRFYDELSTRDKVSAAILAQDGQTAYLIIDDNIRNSLKQIEGYFHLNLAVEADSIEELAKKINMPAVNLKATLDEYNKIIDTKNDPFGRQPNTLEKKITKPNFVAIEITPGVHYTMGGVEIDTNAQVIDVDGNPIKGLYAAGEVTGGVHGANRLGGNSISETVSFGRLAGQEATKAAK